MTTNAITIAMLAAGLESVTDTEPTSSITIIPNSSMQSSKLQDMLRHGLKKETPIKLTWVGVQIPKSLLPFV